MVRFHRRGAYFFLCVRLRIPFEAGLKLNVNSIVQMAAYLGVSIAQQSIRIILQRLAAAVQLLEAKSAMQMGPLADAAAVRVGVARPPPIATCRRAV